VTKTAKNGLSHGGWIWLQKTTDTIPLLLNILAPHPLISLSLPHTTLRCDRGPAPKAFSHLAYREWEGVDPCIPKSRCPKLRHWAPSALRVSGIPAAEKKCFKVAMGEAATEPDRAPRAPPGWTAWIISWGAFIRGVARRRLILFFKVPNRA
jgi:hypothetical protein